ncbi:hypothetical protein DRA43_11215 [Micromonospora provocatoris]|nr:hypothetical protein DRA43_11215 [Micromonospora provocatoris]
MTLPVVFMTLVFFRRAGRRAGRRVLVRRAPARVVVIGPPAIPRNPRRRGRVITTVVCRGAAARVRAKAGTASRDHTAAVTATASSRLPGGLAAQTIAAVLAPCRHQPMRAPRAPRLAAVSSTAPVRSQPHRNCSGVAGRPAAWLSR